MRWIIILYKATFEEKEIKLINAQNWQKTNIWVIHALELTN